MINEIKIQGKINNTPFLRKNNKGMVLYFDLVNGTTEKFLSIFVQAFDDKAKEYLELVQQGDEVIVTGKLISYPNNYSEFCKNYAVMVEGIEKIK